MSDFDFDAAASAMFGDSHPTQAAATPVHRAAPQTNEQRMAETLFGDTSAPVQQAKPYGHRDARPMSELTEAEQAARLYGSTDPTLMHRDAVQAIINAGMEDHLHDPETAEEIAGQWAATFQQHNLNATESAQVAEIGASAMRNPTRTGTRFHGCFHGQRHRWMTRRVDSSTCQITNKAQIDQWAHDYGRDSDFFKVRVLGEFPSRSSLQFIGRDLVQDAATRDLPSARGETVIIGCDIARFGDDSTVLYFRQGRDARTYPPIKLKGADTMQVASRIAEQANFFRSAGHHVLVAIDGGGVGGGVIDRLRAIGHEVDEVQFGSRALDPRKYAQRRSELWGLMRDWLKVGAIANDQELLDDLTGPEYGFTSTEQIQLEKKSDMKARGLSSPDVADALAITFAVTPPLPGEDALPYGNHNERDRLAVLDFNPYAEAMR